MKSWYAIISFGVGSRFHNSRRYWRASSKLILIPVSSKIQKLGKYWIVEHTSHYFLGIPIDGVWFEILCREVPWLHLRHGCGNYHCMFDLFASILFTVEFPCFCGLGNGVGVIVSVTTVGSAFTTGSGDFFAFLAYQQVRDWLPESDHFAGGLPTLRPSLFFGSQELCSECLISVCLSGYRIFHLCSYFINLILVKGVPFSFKISNALSIIIVCITFFDWCCYLLLPLKINTFRL